MPALDTPDPCGKDDDENNPILWDDEEEEGVED